MTTAARVAAAAALLTAGCTYGAQTMEQALAFQRWRHCDTFATITLQRIDLDGQVIVTGSETEQGRFLECMAAEAWEQRRSKPDLVAPPPIVYPLPR